MVVRVLRWGVVGVVVTAVAAWSLLDRGSTLADRIPGLCPGYHEEMTADGLPSADSGTTDRDRVAQVLRAREPYLRSAYQGVDDLKIGPGYGAVWDGENGGSYVVRQIADYAIVARVEDRDDCPRGSRQFLAVEGVPVVFASGRP